MKKMFVSLLAAAIVSIAAIAPAAAQGDNGTSIVNVPFRFIVGDKLMPAGSYRVTPQSDDWSVVMISGVHSNLAVLTPTEAESQPVTGLQKPQFWFNNYYGQYFLAKFAVPGRDARIVKVTKAEAERTLAKLNLMPAERGDPAK